jgi:hypothetical protein
MQVASSHGDDARDLSRKPSQALVLGRSSSSLEGGPGFALPPLEAASGPAVRVIHLDDAERLLGAIDRRVVEAERYAKGLAREALRNAETTVRTLQHETAHRRLVCYGIPDSPRRAPELTNLIHPPHRHLEEHMRTITLLQRQLYTAMSDVYARFRVENRRISELGSAVQHLTRQVHDSQDRMAYFRDESKQAAASSAYTTATMIASSAQSQSEAAMRMENDRIARLEATMSALISGGDARERVASESLKATQVATTARMSLLAGQVAMLQTRLAQIDFANATKQNESATDASAAALTAAAVVGAVSAAGDTSMSRGMVGMRIDDLKAELEAFREQTKMQNQEMEKNQRLILERLERVEAALPPAIAVADYQSQMQALRGELDEIRDSILAETDARRVLSDQLASGFAIVSESIETFEKASDGRKENLWKGINGVRKELVQHIEVQLTKSCSFRRCKIMASSLTLHDYLAVHIGSNPRGSAAHSSP